MAISDYFKNSFETSNVNSHEQLRNHYYGSDVLTTQNQISTTLKRAGFKIGIVTFVKIFHLGIFKIVAASSRFASILRKIPPIKM